MTGELHHGGAEALAEYAASGSEAAFGRVVRAWLPLVMGTALRRTGGRRALAEDVAQLVFIDLARQAGTLRGATVPGWLHRHTCFTAAKMLRGERRRAARERVAAEHAPAPRDPGVDRLDELLLGLAETDRQAVLLRYVEGRSHDEVAAALGISRAAAQKRAERALGRLREALRPDLTEAGLAALVAPAVAGAAGLAERIAGAAGPAGSGAATVAWLSKPAVAGACGAVAALALAAAPLVMAGRDYAAARSAGANGPPPAALARTSRPNGWALPARTAEPARPRVARIASPEQAVQVLLGVAGRHGVGAAGRSRAAAAIESVPAEWAGAILTGLRGRMPQAVAGTQWSDAVCRHLVGRWRPQRVPEDLIEIWPMFGAGYTRSLAFRACAAADLPATRRFLDGFADEQRLGVLGPRREEFHNALREAVLGQLILESPAEAVAFFGTLPQLNAWNPDIVGEDRFINEGRDPVVRAALRAALEAESSLGDHHRQRLRSRLRERDASDDRLDYLGGLVPERLRPQVRQWARARDTQTGSSSEHALGLLETLGPVVDDGDLDRLRVRAVEAGSWASPEEKSAALALVDVAHAIHDPAMRIATLANALQRLAPDSRKAWMRANLTAAESEHFEFVLRINEYGLSE